MALAARPVGAPVSRVAALLGAGTAAEAVLTAVTRAAVDDLGFACARLDTPSGTVSAGTGRPGSTAAGEAAVANLEVSCRGRRYGTLRLTGVPPAGPEALEQAQALAALAAVALRLDGCETSLAGVTDRIGELRRTVEVLREAARADPLTGLANRAYLDERLHQALSRAARRGTAVGLLMIDLNDFKSVNDTFGHPAGDAVLREVAQRLRAGTRPEDTIARYGGDEFVVLFEDVAGGASGVGGGPDASAAAVASRLADAIRVRVGGWVVGGSVGYAVSRPGWTPADLIRAADVSMYRVKRAAQADRMGRPA